MIMGHEGFVDVAYIASALTLGGLIAGILIDQFARRRELSELEQSGVRRRSQRKAGMTK